MGKASAISAIIEDDGSALPQALRTLERRLLDERPALVVVADASDSALAAVLVASKLGIPVEAMPPATEASSVNGPVIAKLTAA